ncbi:DegT/DnrJ/EryC1/StrS family aminotransferase [Pseudemcibacter aquimaris]|uniref:DegT/DnrJ/EryC1/StrS family aminotransferase n=1 Tax=Pseudemcibacter aquimaris TaxID=2857064 RepID=UPI003B82F3E1
MKVNSPWPSFSQMELDAVSTVLQSGMVNYWTGEECKLFELEFAELFDAKYAISLTNGTAALELALEALGVGDGDEVITTPRTFMASASCVVTRGAKPVFADVDFDSGNISAETIEAVITSNTKAIIPVHLAGMPCEMDDILSLAEKYNLYVIEDCAQAHGAKYKGRPVGSIGHFGAFSFCQDKIMTTGGEGGMLITNDEELWKKAWAYKDHGKSYDAVYNRDHPPGFRWLAESFGTNFRMTEMQAAIGRIQLKLLPEWINRRQEYANKLDHVVSKYPALIKQDIPDYIEHARYKYYTYVNTKELIEGWDRDRIQDEFWKNGIPCYVGSCSEIYNEEAFVKKGLRPVEPLPIARELGLISLMFLIHPTLTINEIDATCQMIEKIIGKASK